MRSYNPPPPTKIIPAKSLKDNVEFNDQYFSEKIIPGTILQIDGDLADDTNIVSHYPLKFKGNIGNRCTIQTHSPAKTANVIIRGSIGNQCRIKPEGYVEVVNGDNTPIKIGNRCEIVTPREKKIVAKATLGADCYLEGKTVLIEGDLGERNSLNYYEPPTIKGRKPDSCKLTQLQDDASDNNNQPLPLPQDGIKKRSHDQQFSDVENKEEPLQKKLKENDASINQPSTPTPIKQKLDEQDKKLFIKKNKNQKTPIIISSSKSSLDKPASQILEAKRERKRKLEESRSNNNNDADNFLTQADHTDNEKKNIFQRALANLKVNLNKIAEKVNTFTTFNKKREKITHTLRPYQKSRLDECQEKMAAGKKDILFIMPTGTGKTMEFCSLIAAMSPEKETKKLKTLILVSRDLLNKQTIKKLAEVAPHLSVGIYDSAKGVGDEDIILSTYQGFDHHYKELFPENGESVFNMVIADEFHNAMSESRADIFAYLKSKTTIAGFTATPRFNNKMSGCVDANELLTTVITEMTLVDAVNEKCIAPLRTAVVNIDTGNGKAKINKNGEVKEIFFDRPSFNRAAVKTYCTTVDPKNNTPLFGKQGIVFCAGVTHSNNMAAEFNKHIKVDEHAHLVNLRDAFYQKMAAEHERKRKKYQEDKYKNGKYATKRSFYSLSFDTVLSKIETNSIPTGYTHLYDLYQFEVATVLHSKRSKSEIKSKLKKYKNGGILLAVGTRMLTEGLDLPTASVELNWSGTRSLVNRTQQLGRVLRLLPGKEKISYSIDANFNIEGQILASTCLGGQYAAGEFNKLDEHFKTQTKNNPSLTASVEQSKNIEGLSLVNIGEVVWEPPKNATITQTKFDKAQPASQAEKATQLRAKQTEIADLTARLKNSMQGLEDNIKQTLAKIQKHAPKIIEKKIPADLNSKTAKPSTNETPKPKVVTRYAAADRDLFDDKLAAAIKELRTRSEYLLHCFDNIFEELREEQEDDENDQDAEYVEQLMDESSSDSDGFNINPQISARKTQVISDNNNNNRVTNEERAPSALADPQKNLKIVIASIKALKTRLNSLMVSLPTGKINPLNVDDDNNEGEIVNEIDFDTINTQYHQALNIVRAMGTLIQGDRLQSAIETRQQNEAAEHPEVADDNVLPKDSVVKPNLEVSDAPVPLMQAEVVPAVETEATSVNNEQPIIDLTEPDPKDNVAEPNPEVSDDSVLPKDYVVEPNIVNGENNNNNLLSSDTMKFFKDSFEEIDNKNNLLSADIITKFFKESFESFVGHVKWSSPKKSWYKFFDEFIRGLPPRNNPGKKSIQRIYKFNDYYILDLDASAKTSAFKRWQDRGMFYTTGGAIIGIPYGTYCLINERDAKSNAPAARLIREAEANQLVQNLNEKFFERAIQRVANTNNINDYRSIDYQFLTKPKDGDITQTKENLKDNNNQPQSDVFKGTLSAPPYRSDAKFIINAIYSWKDCYVIELTISENGMWKLPLEKKDNSFMGGSKYSISGRYLQIKKEELPQYKIYDSIDMVIKVDPNFIQTPPDTKLFERLFPYVGVVHQPVAAVSQDKSFQPNELVSHYLSGVSNYYDGGLFHLLECKDHATASQINSKAMGNVGTCADNYIYMPRERVVNSAFLRIVGQNKPLSKLDDKKFRDSGLLQRISFAVNQRRVRDHDSRMHDLLAKVSEFANNKYSSVPNLTQGTPKLPPSSYFMQQRPVASQFPAQTYQPPHQFAQQNVNARPGVSNLGPLQFFPPAPVNNNNNNAVPLSQAIQEQSQSEIDLSSIDTLAPEMEEILKSMDFK